MHLEKTLLERSKLSLYVPSTESKLCYFDFQPGILQTWNFYTTGFSGQKFYTLETRGLQNFLLTIKQSKLQDKWFWSFFVVEIQMNIWEFNSFGKQVCVNLPTKWVNFIFVQKICKEMCCFMEKFTQLENFLHDFGSRQISSLAFCFNRFHGKNSLSTFVARSNFVLQSLLTLPIWLEIAFELWRG